MDKQVFSRKFRAVRDRGLKPEVSWSRRHGPPYIGYTFSICAVKPLTKYTSEDLMWALLEAASRSEITHVQIHFGIESRGKITPRVNGLMRALTIYGFTPMNASMRMDALGKGWISLPLFSRGDIPLSPDKPPFLA